MLQYLIFPVIFLHVLTVWFQFRLSAECAGMIYKDGKYPYLYNLIDQYRHLAKYNRGLPTMMLSDRLDEQAGRWENLDFLFRVTETVWHIMLNSGIKVNLSI